MPIAHHHDPVGKAGCETRVVHGDHHDRRLCAGGLLHDSQELERVATVEAAGGFVEQQNVGFTNHGLCQGDQLSLPVIQIRNRSGGQSVEVQSREYLADFVEDGLTGTSVHLALARKQNRLIDRDRTRRWWFLGTVGDTVGAAVMPQPQRRDGTAGLAAVRRKQFVGPLKGDTLTVVLTRFSVLPALNVSTPESPYLAFIVGLYVAAALALLAFFWRDWLAIIAGFATSLRYRRITTPAERLAWLIIVATIPVGISGLALERLFRTTLGRPVPAAVFLTVNGVLLYAGEELRQRSTRTA